MPGAVQSAVVPTSGGNPLVLPFSLCKEYSQSRALPMNVNEYHDNSRQVVALVETSRKAWKLSKRLTSSVLGTLYDFWKANPNNAFYFYDPFEVGTGYAPGSNHDPTGVSTAGRYKVVFRNDWQQTTRLGRTDVSLDLVEVV